MSFHTFFSFSTGLRDPLLVPKGTLKGIMDHVQNIESVFGLKKEKYKNNPARWVSTKPTTDISNEVYCSEAEKHNRWVRRLYYRFDAWFATPVRDGESLTPKEAEQFWHALTIIEVPPSQWTEDYYEQRMKGLYEVMRGRESEGVTFDAKILSPKQAGAIIWLFAQYLDPGDIRLEVPKGRDFLYPSSEYVWCDKCGPVAHDDVDNEIRNCKRRGCPLRKENKGDEE